MTDTQQAADVALTAEMVRAALHYDPTTGVFRWLDRNAGPRLDNLAGSICSTGHIMIESGERKYKASRLAYLYMMGEWPAADMDHIDLNKTNDRWSNLRPATEAQNQANRPLSKRNKSGAKGVHRKGSRWNAEIRENGRKRWLGSYDTLEAAALAYHDAATKLWGEFYRPALPEGLRSAQQPVAPQGGTDGEEG